MPEGLGAFIYPDFKCDIGIYKRGLPDKLSIIHFKNDDIFIGATIDGEINGIGILIKEENEEYEWTLGKYKGNECQSFVNDGCDYPDSIIDELIRNLVPKSLKKSKKKIGNFDFWIPETFSREEEMIRASLEFKEISKMTNTQWENHVSRSIQTSFKDSTLEKEFDREREKEKEKQRKTSCTQTQTENIVEKDFSRQLTSRIEEDGEEYSDDICNITKGSVKRVRSESPLYPLFQRAKKLEEDIKMKLSRVQDTTLNSRNNEQSWFTESLIRNGNGNHERRNEEVQFSMPQVNFLQTIRLKTTESQNTEFLPVDFSPVKKTETEELNLDDEDHVKIFSYKINEKKEELNSLEKTKVNTASPKQGSGSKLSILEATFGKETKSYKKKMAEDSLTITDYTKPILQPSLQPKCLFPMNNHTIIQPFPHVFSRGHSPVRLNRTYSTMGFYPTISSSPRAFAYPGFGFMGRSSTPPHRFL